MELRRGDQARGHGSLGTDLCRFCLVLGSSVSLCLLSRIASLWCDPVTTWMLAVGISCFGEHPLTTPWTEKQWDQGP